MLNDPYQTKIKTCGVVYILANPWTGCIRVWHRFWGSLKTLWEGVDIANFQHVKSETRGKVSAKGHFLP